MKLSEYLACMVIGASVLLVMACDALLNPITPLITVNALYSAW